MLVLSVGKHLQIAGGLSFISFRTNTAAALMDVFRGCAIKYALKFDLIRNILVA